MSRANAASEEDVARAFAGLFTRKRAGGLDKVVLVVIDFSF